MHSKTYERIIDSPVGKLHLVATDKGLRELNFVKAPGKAKMASDVHPVLDQAEKQLTQYFSGKRHSFDVKLDMHGSVFQLKAWRALQQIPYGKTISYGEQAVRVGNKKAVRAVGGANGRNPICIVVPCHRVIGANGTLTGFGGGLKIKQYLLEHEKKHAA